MSKIDRVGILGAGVIGSSWTALFLAAGHEVDVYEPAPNGEKNVRGNRVVIQSLDIHPHNWPFELGKSCN